MILLFLCASASSPRADEIYFKSGYSETGVVLRETATTVRFRSEMGLFTVSREKIDFLDKASEEENRSLLKKWREKELHLKEQLEAKREAQKKFEDEQRAKGLIKFEDEWMTPERRQEILDLREQALAHHRKFHARQLEKGLIKFQHIWVTPKVEKELLEMEAEIRALSEELQYKTRLVDSLRSAMLNVGSLDEAEDFSQRIEEINIAIDADKEKLNRLFERADEIEAASVKYEAPEEFAGVLPPQGFFE